MTNSNKNAMKLPETPTEPGPSTQFGVAMQAIFDSRKTYVITRYHATTGIVTAHLCAAKDPRADHTEPFPDGFVHYQFASMDGYMATTSGKLADWATLVRDTAGQFVSQTMEAFIEHLREQMEKCDD